MQNVREVQDAFRLRFPDRNPPLRNTIVDNVRKYQNTGTSLNRNKGKSGRELVYLLCTKSRSLLCIPMGTHRNEIRS